MSIPGVVEVPELVDEWAGPAIWSSGRQPADCEAPPLTTKTFLDADLVGIISALQDLTLLIS